LNKGLQFESRISATAPKVFISDNLRLQQILSNLLANAIKFTSKGKIIFSVNKTGEKLLFAVSDTGIGIAPKNQDRIFEDFIQVDNSDSKEYDGIGLGLAISKRIADILHGEIWVRSKLGTGTSFYVTIPILSSASDSPDEFANEVLSNKLPTNSRPRTMLLADDEPLSRKLVENALKSWGWNVISVANGKEVLDSLMTVFVDLIVLDLKMPLFDGLQTTRKIRNNPYHKNIPIIAIAARTTESDQENSFQAGCNDFLSKPIDLKVFKNKLDKWFEHVVENQL